jgi:triosephosphate isomerase
VKPENASEYLKKGEIDGLLIGRAGTIAESADRLAECLQQFTR